MIPDPEADPIGELVEGVEAMTGTKGGKGAGERLFIAPGDVPGERIQKSNDGEEKGVEHKGRRRKPGLMIGLSENENLDQFGWISENTVWINRFHPAFQKVEGTQAENYHIVITVALILSEYLEEGKSPLKFVNKFLMSWGIE